ncbi:MAG: rubrerythrin family protein [Magnetococcales bacterium]|nr:rubrerythrin family protein [Magnetococcales bacterium]
MSTQENLQYAFAGESQANRKYLAFASKAEKEGFAQIAKLFRVVAEAETIHAHAHLRALDGVGSTTENLQAAIAGEAHEFTHMYPGFVAEAKAEGHKRAIKSMEDAMEVEKTHHRLFEQALAAVLAGQDLPSMDIYICPVCGHVEIGQPPEQCPVCNVKKDKFTRMV